MEEPVPSEEVVVRMRVRPFSRSAVVALSAVAVLVVAGAVVAATRVVTNKSGSTPASASAGQLPEVSVVGLAKGRVPWNKRVTLHLDHGTFRSVEVTRADGSALDGSLDQDRTTWTSASQLIPLTRYVARVSYRDDSGDGGTTTVRFRASDSSRHLKATLSPGDGDVVGVGSPVVVYFSRSVPESKRAAVEDRLAVSSTPSRVGAWHWMNSQEVHWRPPTYWTRGTVVTVTADLNQLYLGDGVWGQGAHTATFKIGNSHISRVDVARHEMYVYDNGKLVNTFPISAGRDKYPTKNGVHITFEKSQVVTMDSATVGIPRNSPDGYYEKVYWDVRISYGGAFVHAAPWSVADQGVVNVSHGCVNISTPNAIWFYNFSMRGDIVDVYNSAAAPDLSDPGMSDWNMSWKEWVAGDAAPTALALAAHPPMPRAVEPAAPSAPTTGTTTSYSSHSSASPSPSPTPTRRRTASPSPTATPTPSRSSAH